MIKSMTGFSKTEINENGIVAVIEIKSLNGKFLEVNCRLPKFLSYKELEVRELVRREVNRGSISLNLSMDTSQVLNAFRIDEKAAIDYFRQLENIKSNLKLKEHITLEHVLHFANNLQLADNNENAEEYWNVLKKSIVQGLKSMDKMRLNEGKQILKDIQARIKKIKTAVENVESLAYERIPEEREKLRQRVALLFESDEIDEQRLQLEIVLLADKLDISEECVRLKSHLKYFQEAFKSDEPQGRKLNFLIQEMFREINTMGVKALDAKISQIVVEAKEELEKIREQVQNVE